MQGEKLANKSTKNPPPHRERGIDGQGYTVAGYPHARFGVPTILHGKKAVLSKEGWKGTEIECGDIMKPVRIWVNDLPNGYELVIALECQGCRYTDAIRMPYFGPKQIFNSTTKRTWGLRDFGR